MKRLKYVSRSAAPLVGAEVDAIVAKAQERNRRMDVTGVLVTTGNLFYQVLEGPEAAVDGLYARIRADPRHTDLLILGAEEHIEERYFADWSMQRVDLSVEAGERLEPLREVLNLIVDLRERSQRLTHTLERAIWRELSS
ncbi:MAG: BLUF domain-containing protein [Myxococcales bacterium]|nr:BLUF domain-containing protein [Myxococcales bacterium]